MVTVAGNGEPTRAKSLKEELLLSIQWNCGFKSIAPALVAWFLSSLFLCVAPDVVAVVEVCNRKGKLQSQFPARAPKRGVPRTGKSIKEISQTEEIRKATP